MTDLQKLTRDFDAALESADTVAALDELRVRYFGRKGGIVPALFAELKSVPADQKKQAGEALNTFRD
ncbi:MAG TPA: phenylalanine--tRNA ligase subunit alpha, partial [Thermoanaerobaculia bacterium]